MTLSLAQMLRQAEEMTDIAAIPTMTPEERAQKLAEYQARVEQIGAEEKYLLEQVRQAGTIPDFATAKALSRVARLHRSAQLSLERLQKAITQAEQPNSQEAKADGTSKPKRYRRKR